jgi:integrase/recombinase XerD
MMSLREMLVRDLRTRNRSPHTEEAYVRECRRFAEHFSKPPGRITLEEILGYLSKREQEGAKPASRQLTVAALGFLYGVTLDRPEIVAKLPRVRVPVKQPDILSGSEVEQVLSAVHPLRNRVVLFVAYGAGLRIRECCRLQVGDIDSKRMMIHVRQGKGFLDRHVVLSERLLKLLRDYWTATRPKGPHLFAGRGRDGLLSSKSVSRALLIAVQEVGLAKHVTPHTFRHSFATHLLELGTDIRVIQQLLGHRSIMSTTRYTRLTSRHLGRVRSPLDLVGTEEGERLG